MVGPAVGLVAARRAVRVSGPHQTLSHPVIIEVEPRENIAAGRFGWGLAPWAPAGSVHRVSASGRLLNGAGLGLPDAARSGPADRGPADRGPADEGPADCGHQGQTDQPEIFNQLFLEFFRDGKVARRTADAAGVSKHRAEIPSLVEQV